MLSEQTTTFLNNLCNQSNQVFSDGGTNYIYKFGKSFAHALMPDDVASRFMEKSKYKALSTEHLEQISSFFNAALGAEISVQQVNDISTKLIQHLANDLNFDFIYLEDFDLDSYFGEFTLVMASQSDFHSLEFMWQLD